MIARVRGMLSSNLKASDFGKRAILGVRRDRRNEAIIILKIKELFLNRMKRKHTEWEKKFVSYSYGEANICAG